MARIWRLHPSVDVTEATKGLHQYLPELFRLAWADRFVAETLGVERPLAASESEDSLVALERLRAKQEADREAMLERSKAKLRELREPRS